jgi:hypothetical protein
VGLSKWLEPFEFKHDEESIAAIVLEIINKTSIDPECSVYLNLRLRGLDMSKSVHLEILYISNIGVSQKQIDKQAP